MAMSVNVCVSACMFVHGSITSRHSHGFVETPYGRNEIYQAGLFFLYTPRTRDSKSHRDLPRVTLPVKDRATCENRPLAPRPLLFLHWEEHLTVLGNELDACCLNMGEADTQRSISSAAWGWVTEALTCEMLQVQQS